MTKAMKQGEWEGKLREELAKDGLCHLVRDYDMGLLFRHSPSVKHTADALREDHRRLQSA